VARLSIVPAAEQETLEVDLWGTVFHRVPVTRTRQRQIKDLDGDLQKIDESAEDADDQAVEVMARMLDCILAAGDGGRSKPSTLILKKWKADELAFDQLASFIEDIGDAARPT
jgi:hypothetical protein